MEWANFEQVEQTFGSNSATGASRQQPPSESNDSCTDTFDQPLNERLARTSRQRLPELDPTALTDPFSDKKWFVVTKGITKVIKDVIERDLQGPFPSYTKVPKHYQDRWFGTFAQRYYWDPSIKNWVRDEFDQVCINNYRQYVKEWKKKWKNGEPRVKWMKETVYKGFVEFWSLEKTKTKAEKYSNNKRSERGGKGIMRHTLGSMPMKRLEVELYKKNGVRPDVVTLLEESRRSKKTGEIIDKKAEEYAIKAKEMIQEIVTQRSAEFPEDGVCSTQLANEEILEVYERVAPTDKEGNRYGLGSLRLKASSSRSVPPPGYVPIEQLQATQQALEQNQTELARMDKEFTFMKEFLKRKFPGEDISMTN